MKGTKYLLSSVAIVALSTLAVQSANATVVANIDGCYDCVVYDTPTLTFHNITNGDFINATMTLYAYQPGTLNYNTIETVALPTILAGNNYQYTWLDGYTGTIKGDLTSYDYDDSWGNTPTGYTNANCVVGGSLCSLVGNFSVTFNATISGGTFDGDAISSVFSPTTNKTGGFLGWEGLDPTGLSETVYDEHSGSNSTVNGQLADIVLGSAPAPSPTPLPATLPLFASGLGALGLLGWRRKRKAQAVA